MVIGTALGLSNASTIALAIVLAFSFGYAFTIVPLLKAGLASGPILQFERWEGLSAWLLR